MFLLIMIVVHPDTVYLSRTLSQQTTAPTLQVQEYQSSSAGGTCMVGVILLLLVTGENTVNSYSNQLKMGWVCKFGVEFDNKKCSQFSTTTFKPLQHYFQQQINILKENQNDFNTNSTQLSLAPQSFSFFGSMSGHIFL